MPQIQHSHFNSPCKYTEMNTRCQIFFADLSRFHSILLDTSVQRQSFPYYGRACNCTAKRAGSSRWSLPSPKLAYKHSGHWGRMPPTGLWRHPGADSLNSFFSLSVMQMLWASTPYIDIAIFYLRLSLGENKDRFGGPIS